MLKLIYELPPRIRCLWDALPDTVDFDGGLPVDNVVRIAATRPGCVVCAWLFRTTEIRQCRSEQSLLIILVIALLGGFTGLGGGYGYGFGHKSMGVLRTVLIIILILVLVGRI